jgi:hypothetical protein
MRWLRETHLKKAAQEFRSAKYKAALLYGNEDFPQSIELYIKRDPLITDKPVVLLWNDAADRYE